MGSHNKAKTFVFEFEKGQVVNIEDQFPLDVNSSIEMKHIHKPKSEREAIKNGLKHFEHGEDSDYVIFDKNVKITIEIR